MGVFKSSNFLRNGIKKPLVPKTDVENPVPVSDKIATRQRKTGELKKHSTNTASNGMNLNDRATKNTLVETESHQRNLSAHCKLLHERRNRSTETPLVPETNFYDRSTKNTLVEMENFERSLSAYGNLLFEQRSGSIENPLVPETDLYNRAPKDSPVDMENYSYKKRGSIENPLVPETEGFPLRRRRGSIENPLLPETAVAVSKRKQQQQTASVASPSSSKERKVPTKIRRPPTPKTPPSNPSYVIPPYRGKSSHALRRTRSPTRRTPSKPNDHIPGIDNPRRTLPKYTSRYPSPSNKSAKRTRKQTPKRSPKRSPTPPPSAKHERRKDMSDSEMNPINSDGADD